jgi:hypothetical protein
MSNWAMLWHSPDARSKERKWSGSKPKLKANTEIPKQVRDDKKTIVMLNLVQHLVYLK